MFTTFRSRLALVGLVVMLNAALLVALAGPLDSRRTSPAPSAQSAPSAALSPEAVLLNPAPRPGTVASPAPRTASPSPSPEPVQLVSGDLPPDSAVVNYLPEGGFPIAVEGLRATCNRTGDSLGLLGALVGGPVLARYQIAIAPYHGDGIYLTDAAHGEIGGSVSIVGVVQLFIGPPYETRVDLARDGALGQIRFRGTGVDGKRGEGIIRWECTETKPL